MENSIKLNKDIII